MGYLLIILAAFLFLIASIPGMIIGFYHSAKDSHIGRIPRYENKRLFRMAFNLDRFANAAYPELWDLWFTTHLSMHEFGDIDETMSYVLGKNQIAGTLSKSGIVLKNILRVATMRAKMDWRHWRITIKLNEHCLQAVIDFESKKQLQNSRKTTLQ